MWFITTYQPVSLLSLKVSTATSTGGKSLLLPTPFAFKMALLDVVIRDGGVDLGEALWPTICNGQVAVRGPERIVVNNTFTKILKPNRSAAYDPDTGLFLVMGRTIGFREYVQWQGELQIAFQADSEAKDWARWLTQIHYLGKRGGFIQAVAPPTQADELPDDFTLLTQDNEAGFALDGTLQVMDDCASDVRFDQVNIYTTTKLRVGSDRILRHVILPYRMERSSRGYTLYRRL